MKEEKESGSRGKVLHHAHLSSVDLDGLLGADLLLNQEVGAINTVVSLELENHTVLRVLNNAAVAAEELHAEEGQAKRQSVSKGRTGVEKK